MCLFYRSDDFHNVGQNTTFVTGRGEYLRKIALACKELLVLVLNYIFLWPGKGTLLCWKAFLGADDDSVAALTDLGSTEHPTERVIAGIEKLVCLLYKPKTRITNVKDLRCMWVASQWQLQATTTHFPLWRPFSKVFDAFVHSDLVDTNRPTWNFHGAVHMF